MLLYKYTSVVSLSPDASALPYNHCFSYTLLYTIHYAIRQLLALSTRDTIRNEDHHSLLNISITRSDTIIIFRSAEYRWRDPKCQSTMAGHGPRKELLVPLDTVDRWMGWAVRHWCKLAVNHTGDKLKSSWQSRQYPYPWHAGTWNEYGDGRNSFDSALSSSSVLMSLHSDSAG